MDTLPSEKYYGGFRSALAVSGFRLRARLGFSIPSSLFGQREITPAFGYDVPHSGVGGTLTLLNHALLSAHSEPLRLPTRLHAALCSVEGRASLASSGLPRCDWCPSPRAVPTTPVDRDGCLRRLLLRRAAAFPSLQGGRRPPQYFRGLLRIHAHYGPRIRSRALRSLSSRGFPAADYSAARLGSFRVEPTTSPTELSSAGHQRLSWRTAEFP